MPNGKPSHALSKPSLVGSHERRLRSSDPAWSLASAWRRTAFLLARSWNTTVHPRSARLPMEANDGTLLRQNLTAPTVTWIGHSTLLIQLDGVNFLTDPHWSNRASPVAFAGPQRLTPPGLRFEHLPPIDLVLISHDHYDHLDIDTIHALKRAHRPLFVVPSGLKAWFARRGIAQVIELDWWSHRCVHGLTITCLPVQHFSGRSLWDRNQRLWCGWSVAGRTKRFFFAGDTGYCTLFREIGTRLGPFDLAAIPIGGYWPPAIMAAAHTTPEEALQLLADVQGSHFIGIHWGTFDLTEEPIQEPPRRLEVEAVRRGLDASTVWILRHGETRRW